MTVREETPRAGDPARDCTTARIAELNDALRRDGRGGRLMVTNGVIKLGPAALSAIVAAVRAFDTFTEDNDPYGQHDFGALDCCGERVFWKIDYYDQAMRYGSPDPADPAVTTRVLTILLASEW